MKKQLKNVAVISLLIGITACADFEKGQEGNGTNIATSSNEKVPCHVVYDAGSSGTRLYVYEQNGKSWDKHEGDEVSALADPIRLSNGENWEEKAEATVLEIKEALQAMPDGPPEDGKPKWDAFNWQKRCNLQSVKVYATSGMRMAEQLNRDRSSQIWDMLELELQDVVGSKIPMETRTLTGFEEGLYSWLAVADRTGLSNFGIAEMGGGSAPIAFPCSDCDPSAKGVHTVRIDGEERQFFSHSFLGLGGNEASTTFGVPNSCKPGIGKTDRSWTFDDCAEKIELSKKDDKLEGSVQIYDPNNHLDDQEGDYTTVPIASADAETWFLLGGSFENIKPTDIDDYCRSNKGSYKKEVGCFRSVYVRKFLKELAISQGIGSDWPLGAALCSSKDCLKPATPYLRCEWSPKGCV